MTLLMLVLSLVFLACTAAEQELDSGDLQRDVRIVHYQPEQVHLSFGGM